MHKKTMNMLETSRIFMRNNIESKIGEQLLQNFRQSSLENLGVPCLLICCISPMSKTLIQRYYSILEIPILISTPGNSEIDTV